MQKTRIAVLLGAGVLLLLIGGFAGKYAAGDGKGWA
jgi:hypothetical protein